MATWDETTPYRTGVPTIRTALAVVCRLLVAFNDVIKEHLSEDGHVFVDALAEACQDFLENVPRPGD